MFFSFVKKMENMEIRKSIQHDFRKEAGRHLQELRHLIELLFPEEVV